MIRFSRSTAATSASDKLQAAAAEAASSGVVSSSTARGPRTRRHRVVLRRALKGGLAATLLLVLGLTGAVTAETTQASYVAQSNFDSSTAKTSVPSHAFGGGIGISARSYSGGLSINQATGMIYTSTSGLRQISRSKISTMTVERTENMSAYTGHTIYSPHMNRVYTADTVNAGIGEYDPDTLELKHKFPISIPSDNHLQWTHDWHFAVMGLAVSESQQKIFTMSRKGFLSSFDMNTRQKLFNVDVSSHNDPVSGCGSMVINEAKQELYIATTCGIRQPISVYNIQTGAYLRTINTGVGEVTSLVLNPNTQKIYVAKLSHPPVVVDALTYQVADIVGTTEAVHSPAVSIGANEVYFVTSDAKYVYRIGGAEGVTATSLLEKIPIPETMRVNIPTALWNNSRFWMGGIVNEATGIYYFISNDEKLHSLSFTPY